MPLAGDGDDIERILQNLELVRDGYLTNAAVLLFTPAPQRLFLLAQARVGRFRGADILDSHDFAGSLWDQVRNPPLKRVGLQESTNLTRLSPVSGTTLLVNV